ncbi:MAG: replicative DNA helicase [Candidatus Pacebacteria bacterium]|nr:replicative DNA helicase [Candidatus Paceibacterota bacterium]
MAEDPNKIPPQSIETEKALLGSLMMDKDGIIKVVDFMHPEDFYKENHGIIYQAMLDLYQSGEPIDVMNLKQRLEEKKELRKIGGAAYLSELLETIPTPAHLAHYGKTVREKKVLRDLIKASGEIFELGHKEDKNVDNILDEAEKKIFSISERSLTQGFLPIKNELDDAFERIDKIHSRKEELRGVTTGFSKLDDMLAGFQRGDFILLAARPSLGKTSLALDVARAASKSGVPVGIFSLEMSKEQLVDRLIAAEANLSMWKLRTGKLSGEDEFARIREAMERLSKSQIYIDDAPSASVLHMRAMARRLQAEKKLGIIIIDYLQLIQPSGSSDNIVQQVTEVSRSLKALAKELNVPVLGLSQLSRAVEHRPDQRPRLSDLRESGSLEQDSDVVLFIYREDKVRPNTPEQNIAEIIIAKHRNGPIGSKKLYFNQDVVTFKELDQNYEGEEITGEEVI